MTWNMLLAYSNKIMKNGIYFVVIALLPSYSRFWFMQIRWLVTPHCGHKMMQNHKKCNISEDILCIELKLCTVITLVTKFQYMSIVTFPWQHNGLQALSIQKVKSEFSSFENCYCSSCSFSECEQIWTLYSTSTSTCTRKSVRLWSKKQCIFHFGKA